MADLVDLADVKSQLRLTDAEVSTRVDELMALRDQATAIIVALCDTTEYWRAITPTWTLETVPQTVRAAILKQVAYMNQYRGDEAKTSTEDDGLAPGVKGILGFTRDPVVV